MKYLKESNQIETTYNDGVYVISKGESYLNFFRMKDTYHIVEFNDVLDLDDIYSEIGEECYFIKEIYINPDDSPFLIKQFIKIVEKHCIDDGYDTICFVAEPFLDKRLDYNRLVDLYEKLGFTKYMEIGNEQMLMFKHLY